jgi:hypothetical protein
VVKVTSADALAGRCAILWWVGTPELVFMARHRLLPSMATPYPAIMSGGAGRDISYSELVDRLIAVTPDIDRRIREALSADSKRWRPTAKQRDRSRG